MTQQSYTSTTYSITNMPWENFTSMSAQETFAVFQAVMILTVVAVILYVLFIKPKSCEDSDCPSNPGTQRKPLRLKAFFSNGSAIQSVEGIEMSIVARNDQLITFRPVFEDAFGNAVDVLGSNPVWSLSNQDVAVLTVSEDGKEAVVTPTGATGTVQLNLLVDADPGEAEEPLVGIADIQIVAGKARIIKLTGLVSDKPVVESPAPQPEIPANPEQGTILSTQCVGVDLYDSVADGNGGAVLTLKESNSERCGGQPA